MTSFYYYDQNPSRLSFHIQIFVNPSEVQITIVQESKTLKDSGSRSKVMR